MTILQPGRVYLGSTAAPERVPQYVQLPYANRHGLITGATGTGKTVTLQGLAEGFSAAGVPVFCADVKGDLAGLAEPGEMKDFVQKRLDAIGFTGEFKFAAAPVVFWDLFGKDGHPVRTTMSEMGPLLLSRILDLNDTQEGVLNIAFRIADDEGLLVLDFKDLQALLAHVADKADEITTRYGNVAKATVGAVQRALLVLEQQGAAKFFGEPALDIKQLIRTTTDGRGIVNVLAAASLMQSPRLYATFLLWLMSELFEDLEEIGDPEKPRLVFFFDEAHLLFNDAPKALMEKIEQVVRLIRSKGVGIYFVTQNPADVPDIVLAQLGNRVQHALRAYTPRDQKALKAAADSFRPNPAFDTAATITELGTGEALVSTLEGEGTPSIVQRTLIRPPGSRIGAISDDERRKIIAASPIGTIYDTPVDRQSAFEVLASQTETTIETTTVTSTARPTAPGRVPNTGPGQPATGGAGGVLGDIFGTSRPRNQRLSPTQRVTREVTRTVTNSVVGGIAADIGRQVGGSLGGSVGRAIVRGVLGGILRR
ncbi:MAG TPA: helicase HerA-like domain-containing protein [Bauldia sp.]|nr:helicase HerA-like domain-containing protein [Bauldia sp.]